MGFLVDTILSSFRSASKDNLRLTKLVERLEKRIDKLIDRPIEVRLTNNLVGGPG